MKISICIATVRPKLISAAIASVQAQSKTDWELIIVPQGSSAVLRAEIGAFESADHRIRMIHTDLMNRSAALNVGFEQATGDILVTTDDDCEADPDWLAELDRIFTEHPRVGVVGGLLLPAPPSRRWAISTCPSALVSDQVYQPSERGFAAPPGFYMLGANTAFRREVVARLGPFDTCLGPGTPYGSCEDLDYIVRAESADVCMMTSTRAVVYHTSGRRYGLKAFLAHHRNYARGRGAYAAKLGMWGHRLGDEWKPRRTSIKSQMKSLVSNPPRYAKSRFYDHYSTRSFREFRASHILTDQLVCARRNNLD